MKTKLCLCVILNWSNWLGVLSVREVETIFFHIFVKYFFFFFSSVNVVFYPLTDVGLLIMYVVYKSQ